MRRAFTQLHDTAVRNNRPGSSTGKTKRNLRQGENGAGFTLIEVLTVIAIIGILASLGAYTYAAALMHSRDSQRLADVKIIGNSLEQFYLDNRTYPAFQGDGSRPEATFQLEQLNNPCQTSGKFLAPKYLAQIPQDPTFKFAVVGGCNIDIKGQYLYYGLPKADSKKGYVLGARMERTQDINYDAALASVISSKLSDYAQFLPIFCTREDFTANAAVCSQDYFIVSSKNN